MATFCVKNVTCFLAILISLSSLLTCAHCSAQEESLWLDANPYLVEELNSDELDDSQESTHGGGILSNALGDGNLLETDSEPLSLTEQERQFAQSFDKAQVGDSTFYRPNFSDSLITVSAQYGWKGADDQFGQVYALYGDCQVTQAQGTAAAPVALVWLGERENETDGGAPLYRIYLYLEGEQSQALQLDLNSVCVTAKSRNGAWLGEFVSKSPIDLRIAHPGENQLRPDELYYRALNFLREETTAPKKNNLLASQVATSDASVNNGANEVNVASNTTQEDRLPNGSGNAEPALGWVENGQGNALRLVNETSQVDEYFKNAVVADAPAMRSWRFSSRYDREAKISSRPKSSQSQDGDGKDVYFISNGFTLTVQGLTIDNIPIGDVLELSADQATIWTSELTQINFSEQTSPNEYDFELYLDGNVVFRQGDNVIYAERMYYDLKNRVGIIDNAELVAEAPDMPNAYFRLGASRITQRSADVMYATDAWASTSAMGVPTYRLQANSLVTETSHKPLYDATTGRQLWNSQTGEPLVSNQQYIIAENNYVTIGNLPVLYWPWMAMDIKDRSLYLSHLKFGHDNVFGTQVRTSWNPFQLFGMSARRPDGVDWDLNLDYLSKRGFGHGTTFVYNRDSLWGWNTRAVGMANYYGIYDKGTDNLGHARRAVPFEKKYRYRGIWKHRQELGSLDCDLGLCDQCCIRDGWTLTAQLGKSSDRNYIPQYFEEEWNTLSNPETRVELKRTVNNRSLGVTAAVRTDSFYTQSNWLPRFDHYWLGQTIGNSSLTWYEHTKIGYAQFKPTDSPYAEQDKALFRYLDWELANGSASNLPDSSDTTLLSRDSLVFSTRQELDLPFQLGPVKTTPYALGEYGFWGHSVTGKNVSRLYGQLGVRFNLPIWKINSDVESQTWYLNGLAHKMNFVVDASYSDANKNYDDLILYDQIDDWQVEDFRRRYSVTTFAGQGAGYSDSIPVRFDERYYAIRQGVMAGNVTAPSTELVDDMQTVRLGWDNRWQTKRGPVGNRRVVDWIVFNAGINLYPKTRDNFGKTFGLLDYDAAWQVGDRFAILSSGLYDFWGTGQKITRVGVQRRRPGLSSCYLGVDRLDGPIDSTYLNFGLTYRASEKWGIGFSNSFDISEGYNIGQKISISRIGESFVFTLGASRNESKDNWGVNLSVEPVFLFDKDKREEGLLGLGNM
ncbi:MAG: hypothetical protein Q4G03_03190 [Planctomycetia bacterium]|nr:hypothetical protein [Planctomycetia bacterium]